MPENWLFLEKVKHILTIWHSSCTPGHLSHVKGKFTFTQEPYRQMFTAASFGIAQTLEQLKRPSPNRWRVRWTLPLPYWRTLLKQWRRAICGYTQLGWISRALHRVKKASLGKSHTRTPLHYFSWNDKLTEMENRLVVAGRGAVGEGAASGRPGRLWGSSVSRRQWWVHRPAHVITGHRTRHTRGTNINPPVLKLRCGYVNITTGWKIHEPLWRK